MDNIKGDDYYITKGLEDIEAILRYTECIPSYEEFVNDSMLVDAVMFRLVQLIENIKNISSQFKSKHQEIPWGDIMGFRNGIVHEYGNTDYAIVYEIVVKDIYSLKELFEQTH